MTQQRPDAPASEPSSESAVELRGIVKRFPGVLACDHVDLSAAPGEIHAVMGENGAGKSTLMSILYGLTRPDEGTIEVAGRPVAFTSAAQAIAAGIGMVQQGFALFDSLTVTDNVIFGAEPTRRGFVDRRAANAAVAALIERHELRLSPTDRVGDLPVGLRQQVEILKLLHRRARVLILDEPTAVLTPAETERLFVVLRELAADEDAAHTVLLVSHKLHEVLAVSDNVTVLRDGRVTMTAPTAGVSRAVLAEAMTGRAVDLDRVYPPGEVGEVLLSATGLTVHGDGKPLLDDVSLTVRVGEIVGVAAVAGNGQTELVAALAGLRPLDAGSIRLGDRDLGGLSGRDRRAAGIAHVPEDRAEVGSAPGARLSDNLAVGHHRRLAHRGWLRPAAVREHASRIVERFGVRAPSPTTPMRTLSGGNQQKAIIGRELAHDAPVLLVEQPTRGVDIGAVVHIHTELVAYRDAGHAVLLVSAELSEILGLADRVLVMYEGRVVAELSRGEADPGTMATTIGLAMAGVTP